MKTALDELLQKFSDFLEKFFSVLSPKNPVISNAAPSIPAPNASGSAGTPSTLPVMLGIGDVMAVKLVDRDPAQDQIVGNYPAAVADAVTVNDVSSGGAWYTTAQRMADLTGIEWNYSISPASPKPQ
jgi:hypothetical protein